ncbi:MAG TPA: aminotransferase class I/II-fold pyridoxal phosphate-dependent enzyme [Candidatus Dormibacteraeota bacterium]|nr:aminotransferase class I/II-fold pyridoxal phosphate-dependent enzyme [Candidatus Dormibacteraeota bacterium]
MSRLFANGVARVRERRTGRAAERLRGLTLSPIKDVELQASRIPGVVSLAQGIPSFDTPEPIKRFAAERMAEGACARYSVSPGLPALREAIAESLAGDGMPYDPDREILVTVGSIEAIAATLLAHVDEGDEVLVVSPTYASYLPAIRLAGGVPRWVPLNEDAHFDLDPDAIADAVSRRTRAILLCNPNNPTGTVFSRAQTLRMLRVAAEHDLLVITDEVYKDFVYSEAGIFSAAMEPSARERVIRVCSFSKAYGMTGWRVGFLHGPAERVADVLTVHDALVTCAPVISQYAALAALEQGDPFVAEFAAEFRRRRDHVVERLDALSHVFDYQKPNASYFAFPRVKDTVPFARDSRRLAAELLQHARVALVPGVAFGPTGEAHLRLCFARPAADVDLAFDRLTEYFGGRPARDSIAVPATVPPRAPTLRLLLRRRAVALLRRLARTRLERTRPKVVAITGTHGKTVLKRALTELLARRLRVHANPLSYNTAIGLPLAVLDTEMDTRRPLTVAAAFARALWSAYGPVAPLDVMVLELGVRRAGDMRSHLEIVRPDVVVVTPVAASYRDDLDALETLREEIALLCRDAARHGATVLLCGDDPVLAALAAELPGATTFSAAELQSGESGLTLLADGRSLPVRRDVVGASSQRALAAAVHVARALGMDETEIAAYLAS